MTGESRSLPLFVSTVALCVALGAGCEARIGDVAGDVEPIARGTREAGVPEVVFLYNIAGSACTATIIAPRVVLTAKHCVQAGTSSAAPARQFRVYVGSSTRALTAEYTVAEVRVAPGGWDASSGADVALLILNEAATETPHGYSLDRPGTLAGATITAIGYGQTADGVSGTKFRTTATVQGVMTNLIFVTPSVCSGDSGGPIIGPDGLVYGVASFIYSTTRGAEPVCGTAPGVYTGIYPYLDMIEQAITDSGTCVPHGAEVCDGIDNDCNELIDEVCTPTGSPCTNDDECASALCAMTPIGRVCTSMCDATTPFVGCSPGLYCASTGGCAGVCIPGAAGSKAMAEACASDTECASLYCRDPGDGMRRCLEPCRFDAGLCLAGEACAALPGECGGCVDADVLHSSTGRGLGEPCARDTDCHSGSCLEDGGLHYCSTACTGAEDTSCGTGFHCRDMHCVHGVREGVGGNCRTNEDCGGAICATRGEVGWCTSECTDASTCPPDFTCEMAGGASVCAPSRRLLGEDCTSAGDCISGMCALLSAGRETCTRFCGAASPCPTGFECMPTGSGTDAVCVPPAPPVRRADSGGCAAVTAPSHGTALVWIGLFAVGLALVASRRRRREQRRG